MSKNTSIIPGVSNTNLARVSLIKRLGCYGFIECALIVAFLQLICEDEPGYPELRYISDKVQECLLKHDSGDDYFMGLREVARDIRHVVE
ncbi:hypothetical protein [Enterobacter cloacae]|uniref:hypothetical protein n=1 Tax=Enterobacter cloacae TaxID=550 RepID=UPI002FFBE771